MMMCQFMHSNTCSMSSEIRCLGNSEYSKGRADFGYLYQLVCSQSPNLAITVRMRASEVSRWGTSCSASLTSSRQRRGEHLFLSSSTSSSKSSRSGQFFPNKNGRVYFSPCRLRQEGQGGLPKSRSVTMLREMSGPSLEEEQMLGSMDSGFVNSGLPGEKAREFGSVRVAAGGKVEEGDTSVSERHGLEAVDIPKERRKSKTVRRTGLRDRTSLGAVEVTMKDTGNNSRQIVARIALGAPLEDVWAILTDYEHLADFFPGLTKNEVLERRHNGARLYQVGEQNIAFGLKFNAKAVVECEEKPIVVHPNFIQRDIGFDTIEGDFHIFRGIWRMEQEVNPSSEGSSSGEEEQEQEFRTTLSYHLDVQPRRWLPVSFVEGRLTTEVKKNLISVRDMLLQP